MNDHRADADMRPLRVSMFATAGLGVGAVLWGIATESRVILFDGVYMLAGIVLVAVSMIASRAATMAPSREYPFGRHAARPLAVALQGSAILGTLVYGVADALVVIFAGGTGNPAVCSIRWLRAASATVKSEV